MNYNVTVQSDLGITVNDPRVIDRVLNNEDNWQGTFYRFTTAEEVIAHLAYNYVSNGRTVNSLDGWADLPASAVTYNEGPIDVDVR